MIQGKVLLQAVLVFHSVFFSYKYVQTSFLPCWQHCLLEYCLWEQTDFLISLTERSLKEFNICLKWA